MNIVFAAVPHPFDIFPSLFSHLSTDSWMCLRQCMCLLTAHFSKLCSRWAWQGEATGAHVHPGGPGAAEDTRPPHTLSLRVTAPRAAGTNPLTPPKHSSPKVRRPDWPSVRQSLFRNHLKRGTFSFSMIVRYELGWKVFDQRNANAAGHKWLMSVFIGALNHVRY